MSGSNAAALRERLFEELSFHYGVNKLIDWVCQNTPIPGKTPEQVKQSYMDAIYGLTQEELDQIRKEVDSIG